MDNRKVASIILTMMFISSPVVGKYILQIVIREELRNEGGVG